MTKEDFSKRIHDLLGGCSEKTINVWIGFAKDCVDSGQYAYFANHPQPKDKAIESWLDYQYAELYFVKKEFGSDIAKKIFGMADRTEHPHCLYPFEMNAAAKYFRKNYGVEKIVDISINQNMDSDNKPRTMKDVQRDIARKRNHEAR